MNTPATAPARRLLSALLLGSALVASSALTSGLRASTTLSFENADSIASVFPSTSVQGTGSGVGFNNNRIHLFAGTGTGGTANANAYSAAGYSDALNFFGEGGITLTFENVSMTISTSGTQQFFNFGLSNGNSGNFSSATQRVFFQIDRNSSSLRLFANGTALATWSLDGGYRNLASASITLTATTWSASVLSSAAGAELQTQSGTFSTPRNPDNWDQFHIGLQAGTGATAADRSVNGYIGSIEIQSGSTIPEPSAAASLAAIAVFALVVGLRRNHVSRTA